MNALGPTRPSPCQGTPHAGKRREGRFSYISSAPDQPVDHGTRRRPRPAGGKVVALTDLDRFTGRARGRIGRQIDRAQLRDPAAQHPHRAGQPICSAITVAGMPDHEASSSRIRGATASTAVSRGTRRYCGSPSLTRALFTVFFEHPITRAIALNRHLLGPPRSRRTRRTTRASASGQSA